MSERIERVVVALDAVSEYGGAIGAAVRLAARWKARLHGVFVEDDELLRLADMPFARQVTLGLGSEVLTLQHAERQLRLFAERARRELAESARRHGLEWSFETVRGWSLSADAAAMAQDFFVAAATTRAVGSHFRMQGRWQASESAPAVSLFAHRDQATGPVAVLLRDRDPVAERLLAVAVQLATAVNGELIAMIDPALAATAAFKTWLQTHVAGHGVTVAFEPMPERHALRQRLATLRCRLLALAAGSEEAAPNRLRELLANAACDVLIVR